MSRLGRGFPNHFHQPLPQPYNDDGQGNAGQPQNTVPPVITGPPTVGQTLSVTPGTWV